jgi:hypothetical protein
VGADQELVAGPLWQESLNMSAPATTDRQLRESLQRVGYLADADLATTVWLAGELQR